MTIKRIIKDWANNNIALLRKEQANVLHKQLSEGIIKIINNCDFWTLFVAEKDEERDVIDKDELKEKLGLEDDKNMVS